MWLGCRKKKAISRWSLFELLVVITLKRLLIWFNGEEYTIRIGGGYLITFLTNSFRVHRNGKWTTESCNTFSYFVTLVQAWWFRLPFFFLLFVSLHNFTPNFPSFFFFSVSPFFRRFLCSLFFPRRIWNCERFLMRCSDVQASLLLIYTSIFS